MILITYTSEAIGTLQVQQQLWSNRENKVNKKTIQDFLQLFKGKRELKFHYLRWTMIDPLVYRPTCVFEPTKLTNTPPELTVYKAGHILEPTTLTNTTSITV